MRFRIKSFLHTLLLLAAMLIVLFNHTWAQAIIVTATVSSVEATDITANKTSNTLGLLQRKIAGIEKQMYYYIFFNFFLFISIAFYIFTYF